jgi:hypothetical protein
LKQAHSNEDFTALHNNVESIFVMLVVLESFQKLVILCKRLVASIFRHVKCTVY